MADSEDFDFPDYGNVPAKEKLDGIKHLLESIDEIINILTLIQRKGSFPQASKDIET